MDVNKDEAGRCIEIAISALRNSQPEKARRFLEKAQQLFPTDKAKALLESIRRNGQPSNESGPSRTGPRPRRPREEATETARSYTTDQLDSVKRIKECKDYYEILAVDKDASEDDLKRAYRKLALKFHPDKNHAPGATEAFKAIGNAYAVLSNTDKRRQYDHIGEKRAHSSGDGQMNGDFEADISPEDLFNMFFGGGFPSSNVHAYSNGRMQYTYRPRPARRQQQREGGLALFVQLMPILILVIVSAISQLMVPIPPYSLSLRPSAGHTHKRLTESLGVPYYVGDQFSTEYDGINLKNVERSVEDDYISNLRNNCWKEKQQKEGLLYRARYFGDSDLYQSALKMGTPSCSRLSEIQSSLHG
ncbi:hypothetical protein COCON_G00037230 [Conger conger]|uniref:J domain-containing protein n=1 Tax=Conger conger TaxID=82655 RepID=A0A9Q1DZW9_CONCO|nr:dnaJ homolog subfamily B member 12-like [Conger conger]KAJ8284873.1 hypothetical protein COCON_G00037230 [Conger conger]